MKWQWANKNAFYDSDSVRVVATAALPGWQVPFDWQFGDPLLWKIAGVPANFFFAAAREEIFVTERCDAKHRLEELMRVRLLRYEGCMYV